MSGLRATLAARRAVGTFLKLAGTPALAMARERFDFVIVDREHSPLSEEQALALIEHGAALGLPTLLRIPELVPGEVNRALEAGAAGIQLSQVRSAEQVRALRDACEYAPRGTRSVSLAHPVARFGAVDLAQHIASSAGRPLVVAQLESVLDAGAYREILAAGPDVAFVGVTDLTVDCGFDAAAVDALVATIAAAARAAGVTLGAFGLGELEQNRYLVASSDLAMLRDGMDAAHRRAMGQP